MQILAFHGSQAHSVSRAAPQPALRPFSCSRRTVVLRSAESNQFSLPPSEVTLLIKDCDSHQQLHEFVRDQGPAFNFIHAAAAFTHAAQLAQQLQNQQQPAKSVASVTVNRTELLPQQGQGQQEFEQQWTWLLHCLPPVLQAVQQQCSSFQGRQVANCIWASQRLLHILQWQQLQQQEAHSAADVRQASRPSSGGGGVPPLNLALQQRQHILSNDLQQLLLLLLQQLVQQAESCWHLFTGPELVLLLYSVMNVPKLAACAGHSSIASLQSSVEEAFSSLESQPNESSSSSSSDHEVAYSTTAAAGTSQATVQPRDAEAGSFVVGDAWAGAALWQLQRQQQKGRLRLKPQEFEMLLISLRRIKAQQQQQQQRKSGQQQQQQQQLWDPGAGAMRKQPPQQQQTTQLALSTIPLKLPMQLLQQQLVSIVQRPERCSSRDVCSIVYSYAVLTNSKASSSSNVGSSSSSLRKLAATLTPKALRSNCNPADVTNLLYGLALVTPSSSSSSSSTVSPAGQTVDWWRGLLQGIARQLSQLQAAELVICVYALGRIFGGRLRPPQQLLTAMVTAAAAKLQPQQQQELVMLLWAVGKLGFKPKAHIMSATLDKYLAGAAGAVQEPQQQQRQQLEARHVSIVLWACGRIGFCPPAKTFDTLLNRSMALLPYTAAENLAHVAYGLGSLGVRPKSRWLSRLYRQMQVKGLGSSAAAAEAVGGGLSDTGFTEQGLAMVFCGLSRMRVTVSKTTSNTEQGAAGSAAEGVAASAGSSSSSSSSSGSVDSAVSFHDVITSSAQLLQKSPAAVGGLLWGLFKLCYKPEPQFLQAALEALVAKPQQQQQQHGVQRQQQQQLGIRRQQQQQDANRGRQLMHSLSLAAWSTAKLDPGGQHKQLLLQALKVQTQQLQFANPVDLIALLWSCNQLQLQPTNSWLLTLYSTSRDLLHKFTDLQLASLAVLLEKLLLLLQAQQQQQQKPPDVSVEEQQQQQQHPEQGEDWQQKQKQQRQVLRPPVPPAVWQLQLELEVRQRWQLQGRKAKQRISRPAAQQMQAQQTVEQVHADGTIQVQQQQQEGVQVPEEQQQQQQQKKVQVHEDQQQQRRQQEQVPYDPLLVVWGVLRRWRRISLSSSWSAGAAAGAAVSSAAIQQDQASRKLFPVV